MKQILALVLFPLVILGPYYPAFPIPSNILYLSSTALILSVAAILAATDRVFASRYLPSLLAFTGVICGLSIFVKGYSPFFIELIISGLLGYLAFRYLRFASGFLFVILFLCSFFIGYYLITGSLEDVFTPRSGGGAGLSKNFVQISLLHLYLVYYALCVKGNKPPSHLPILIFPFIAIASAGAGSTVVSVLLLLGYLLIRFRVSIVKMSAVFLVLLLGAVLAQSWILSTELASRLSSGFVGLDRLVLITRFVDGLDLTTAIAGYDESVTFAPGLDESLASSNLHNSYLNLYRDVGISALFYIMVVIYIAYHLVRINGILALLFVGSLIRAITDGYYFNWYFIDFILFYLLLMTPMGKKILGYSSGKLIRNQRYPSAAK